MSKIYFILIFFFASQNSYSQKSVTISGKIDCLKNSMIYLGNKSLNFGNKYVVFDSVYSKDGSFEFANFKFKETDFYSIQYNGCSSWLPFLIDTGLIFIKADDGSFLSLGEVTGSNENDLFHLYSKNIIGPYFKANRSDFDSINKYRQNDSSLYRYYSDMSKKEDAKYLLNQEKFLEQHPESYVSLMILNEIQDEIPEEKLHFYFNLLSPELQQHSKAIKLRKRVQGI